MRMFNADGSEGEMCGNGIRCFVRFALEVNALNLEERPVSVETGAGVLAVTPIWTDGEMTRASVGMGRPILEPADIPFALQGMGPVIDHVIEVAGSKIPVTGVSMGNPHAVMFINKDVDDYPLHDIGPLVESHPLFPNKTRVWERGSGLTQACGTGACAVVVSAHLKGLVDDSVTVELPGGALEIYWTGQGEVIMEGPVAEVFEGEWLG
jgi:diaminopimelate epimerase